MPSLMSVNIQMGIYLFMGGFMMIVNILLFGFSKVRYVKYFALCSIGAGLIGVNYAIIYLRGYEIFPVLYGWGIILPYLNMPFSLISFQTMIFPESRPGKKYIFYFSPAIVRFVTLIPFLKQSAKEKLSVFQTWQIHMHPDNVPGTGNYPLFLFVILFYLFACAWVISRKLEWKVVLADMRSQRISGNFLFWLFLMVCFEAIFVGIHTMMLEFGFISSFIASMIILQSNTLMVSLLLFFSPYLFQLGILRTGPEFTLRKYFKSTLLKTDLKMLEKNLDFLIESEKIYCDENLKLESLAKKLNIKPHQLSEYFNTILNEDFRNFLNRHRIRETIKILSVSKSRDKENLLKLALDVGFNSYTAFYNAFKKHTGSSPKNYTEIKLGESGAEYPTQSLFTD